MTDSDPIPHSARTRTKPRLGRVLEVTIPGGAVFIRPRPEPHPLLGAVDEISAASGPLTVVGRTDWDCPHHIPPLWQPARLPSGAGTAILNVLAERALGALRYCGPYPSAALYDSLLECFSPSASCESFTRGAETAAASGVALEPPVDFVPAPFARVSFGELTAQTRAGRLEAVFALGARFSIRERFRRLEPRGENMAAVLRLGGALIHEVTVLDRRGRPLSDLAAPAPRQSAGLRFPEALERALWALASASAPTLLGAPLRAIRAETPIRWADCGLEAARGTALGIDVHIGFADSQLEPNALLSELAAAIVPVTLRRAQAYAEAKRPLGASS